VRVGLQEVRVVVLEPNADWHALRRARADDLLAHRAQERLHLQPAEDVLGLRVAAMLEGLLLHETAAEIDRNYTDTHGASIVGFAFCHLLGFHLLPRLKRLGTARLCGPGLGGGPDWPELAPVISNRPIDWDLIAQQYDRLVKYATALKLGTAEGVVLFPLSVRA
jgi:Tn3 transposase DDE domain